MKADDFRLVVEAIHVAVEHQKEELFKEIDRKIESYRRAVWVRDSWCCEAMASFAIKFWGVAKPKRDYEFGTTLHLRGVSVNYCPFCGVFVGQEPKREP